MTRFGLAHEAALFLCQLVRSFQQFAPEREDLNGTPAANVLAQTAPGALSLVHHADAEEVGNSLGMLKAERIEWADADAEFTARAGALVLGNDGLRPLILLEKATDFTGRVEDGFGWTDHSAGAAVDAERRVDEMKLVAPAADSLGGQRLVQPMHSPMMIV